jgi:hypothetical protein
MAQWQHFSISGFHHFILMKYRGASGFPRLPRHEREIVQA